MPTSVRLLVADCADVVPRSAGFSPAIWRSRVAFSRPSGSAARAAGFSPAVRHSLAAFSRPGGSAARAVGFTLLEIVVVLSILGLVTAMTAPAMLRSIDSWRRQAQVDMLVDQIRGLPGRARGSGRAIEISDATLAADDAPLRVEEGWQLTAPAPWRVQANGVCDDAELRLQHESGRSQTLHVQAPFCDMRAAPE